MTAVRERILLTPFWWEEWVEPMLVIEEYIVQQFIIRLRTDRLYNIAVFRHVHNIVRQFILTHNATTHIGEYCQILFQCK